MNDRDQNKVTRGICRKQKWCKEVKAMTILTVLIKVREDAAIEKREKGQRSLQGTKERLQTL